MLFTCWRWSGATVDRAPQLAITRTGVLTVGGRVAAFGSCTHSGHSDDDRAVLEPTEDFLSFGVDSRASK